MPTIEKRLTLLLRAYRTICFGDACLALKMGAFPEKSGKPWSRSATTRGSRSHRKSVPNAYRSRWSFALLQPEPFIATSRWGKERLEEPKKAQ
jgi:hypothetical protein